MGSSIYTIEKLGERTVAELRELCRSKGITGMSKARKDEVIDSLIEFQSRRSKPASKKETSTECYRDEKAEDVEQITTNLHSTIRREDGQIKDVSTTVHISAGAASLNFQLAGESVGKVAERMKHILNINTTDINALVNGKNVNESYVLKSGDSLEFLKPASKKG